MVNIKEKVQGKHSVIFSNYDDRNNPYYGGGGAYAVHEVARRLAGKYKVTVLTGNYPGSGDEHIDGVFYQRIPVTVFGPKLGQILYHIQLPYYVRTLNYDIWIESFTPPISGSFLQLFTVKPVIALVHFLSGEDMWRKYRLPFFLIEAAGIRTYRFFISVTSQIAQKIRNNNHTAEIHIIPNGFDTDLSRIRYSPNRKHILFIGRIEINQKGLDLLLKSYSIAAAKIGLPLVIAGSGLPSDEHSLRDLIKSYGLTDTVKYAGYLSGKAKISAYRNAACVVLPSRFESFSITALEALAAGIPLITFDIPGLSWIPDTCRIKVQSFNIREYSRAMVNLVSNPSGRNRMTRLGRIFSRQFSWQRIARQYEALICRITGNYGLK